MVLTAASCSPRCAGLVGHRHPQGSSTCGLDPSVGGSGPHDLTVRARAARLATRSRPPHPAPRFVTTAKRLFGERGTSSFYHNFEFRKDKYFCRARLTRRAKQAADFRCFARRVVEATVSARDTPHP